MNSTTASPSETAPDETIVETNVVETRIVTTTSPPPSRAADYGLWALQAALATIFVILGITHLALPMNVLADAYGWPADLPAFFTRFIGFLEVAGAVALIVPAATRVWPIVSAFAATCLCGLTIMASLMHFIRYDFAMVPFPLVLALASGFLAWARLTRVPIVARRTLTYDVERQVRRVQARRRHEVHAS